MRRLLPLILKKSYSRIALVAAAALFASTATISAKVIKPDFSERTDDRLRVQAPAQPATAQATAPAPANTPNAAPNPVAPTTAPSRPPVTTAKPAAADPNQADPPSERANAAAERAKRALADEGSEDYSNTAPIEQPTGQAATPNQAMRTAARPPKPDSKCVAGC